MNIGLGTLDTIVSAEKIPSFGKEVMLASPTEYVSLAVDRHIAEFQNEVNKGSITQESAQMLVQKMNDIHHMFTLPERSVDWTRSHIAEIAQSANITQPELLFAVARSANWHSTPRYDSLAHAAVIVDRRSTPLTVGNHTFEVLEESDLRKDFGFKDLISSIFGLQFALDRREDLGTDLHRMIQTASAIKKNNMSPDEAFNYFVNTGAVETSQKLMFGGSRMTADAMSFFGSLVESFGTTEFQALYLAHEIIPVDYSDVAAQVAGEWLQYGDDDLIGTIQNIYLNLEDYRNNNYLHNPLITAIVDISPTLKTVFYKAPEVVDQIMERAFSGRMPKMSRRNGLKQSYSAWVIELAASTTFSILDSAFRLEPQYQGENLSFSQVLSQSFLSKGISRTFSPGDIPAIIRNAGRRTDEVFTMRLGGSLPVLPPNY